MIFQRSLLREFASTGIATFIVLLAITITTQLIRFLGYAARGNISSDAVLTFLGFASLRYVPILLSLTLYISVLLTLTRSFRDSEMVVWFTSGQGLNAWIRPVLIYAVPLVFVVGVLSLLLSPWAMAKTDEFRQQLESQDDVAAISPGVFKESRHEERVFFVEKLAANLTTVANIFVHSDENGEIGTTVANQGYQETAPNGDRFLSFSMAGATSAHRVRPSTGSSNSRNTGCASRPMNPKSISLRSSRNRLASCSGRIPPKRAPN